MPTQGPAVQTTPRIGSDASSEGELVDAVAALEKRPFDFTQFAFPWREPGDLANFDGPEDWSVELFKHIQAELLAGKSPIRAAVASGHGIGKSTHMALCAHWALSTMVDARVVVIAGTGAQLLNRTQPEFAKWNRMCLTGHWFDLTKMHCRAKSRSHADTWSLDFATWREHCPESLAGLHNKGKRIVILIDEASQVPDTIWEVIEGAMTDDDTQIILLAFGNPTRNTGRFRSIFGSKRDNWYTRQIDSRSVRITNKELIASWAEEFGEDSDFFRVRVRGLFPRHSTQQLISFDDVREARAREPIPDPSAPVILGVDVGGDGADSDRSVIAIRQGLDASSRPWPRYRGIDLMHLASEVSRCAIHHHATAIAIDVGGIGKGCFDRVKRLELPLGCQVYPVNFGSRPNTIWGDNTVKVANKAAEIWWRMKLWLAHGSIPDSAEIEEDLVGREYQMTGAGEDLLALEKKAHMRARGLASPDHGDALAVTMAVPARAPSIGSYRIDDALSAPGGNGAESSVGY